ncbi:MAG TPA: Rieske 2Fe-2S domain-containing protein [Trueperaceae bacterium]
MNEQPPDADDRPGTERPDRSDEKRAHDPERRRFVVWLWRLPVVAAVAGAGYALYEGSRVLLGKRPAAENPRFEAIEPVAVAPLTAFESTWDAVRFDLHGKPAIAMRLPEPVAGGLSADGVHLAGFSRVCTHQGCIVSLNRDTEAIAFGFNYRTDTPELVCPCHLSVFSPLAGGEAVSGPATQPLPRVQLRNSGGTVMAVGIEVAGG